jgi:hypothetical protein
MHPTGTLITSLRTTNADSVSPVAFVADECVRKAESYGHFLKVEDGFWRANTGSSYGEQSADSRGSR